MGQKARILIVDDEAVMRRFLQRTLESEGYAVETASSGSEALLKIGQRTFHLVLADIVMPGMDGVEMLRRAKEIDADAVVILMTGYSSLQHATEAIQYEAYRYLTKPFKSVSEVLSVVAEALGQRSA